jgi:hypothetical protein
MPAAFIFALPHTQKANGWRAESSLRHTASAQEHYNITSRYLHNYYVPEGHGFVHFLCNIYFEFQVNALKHVQFS